MKKISVKKGLLILSCIGLLILSIVGLTGCNGVAKHFGGTINIQLEENQKLVTATWKDSSLWYLTKPMKSSDVVETYIFQEDSNFGIAEGKVIFKEKIK